VGENRRSPFLMTGEVRDCHGERAGLAAQDISATVSALTIGVCLAAQEPPTAPVKLPTSVLTCSFTDPTLRAANLVYAVAQAGEDSLRLAQSPEASARILSAS